MNSDKTHWGKLYGSLCLHPKWLATPAEGRALWTSALSYCIVIGSDGDVPEGVLHMLTPPGTSVATGVEQLLNSGLWEESTKGYRFHDWEAHQQTVDERKSLRAKRSEAGKASAEAKRRAKSEQDGNTGSTSVETSAEQKVNTLATEKRREEKSKNTTAPADAYTDEFETFWKVYPRKIDKAPAFKAWKTAVKRADVEIITAAARMYARECKRDGTETKFVKHGATWLNAKAWENYTNAATITRDGVRQVPEWSKDECDNILGGPDYWSCPRPPEGLSIQDEMQWKREQTAKHLDERRRKAWEAVNSDERAA